MCFRGMATWDLPMVKNTIVGNEACQLGVDVVVQNGVP